MIRKERIKMSAYYFNKTVGGSFEEAESRLRAELKKEGFGVLTEIDVKETMKKKLDVDFRRYKILGACNPPFAHKVLQVEDKIGTMLPCNVIIQEKEGGGVEVAAIDPVASMQAVENRALEDVAVNVRDKLKTVIERV
jgi:uncharacterized protein (DUF302 family)